MPRRLATVHVAPTVTLFHRAATYCGLWIDRPVESRLRIIALDGQARAGVPTLFALPGRDESDVRGRDWGRRCPIRSYRPARRRRSAACALDAELVAMLKTRAETSGDPADGFVSALHENDHTLAIDGLMIYAWGPSAAVLAKNLGMDREPRTKRLAAAGPADDPKQIAPPEGDV